MKRTQISSKRAKKILPKAEFEQFESVIDNQISRTSRSKLMQKASVARKLRDKYRDIGRRQGAAAKRRMTNTIDTAPYQAKADVFDQIINRIDEELKSAKRGGPVAKPATTKQTRTSADDDLRNAIREIASRHLPTSVSAE